MKNIFHILTFLCFAFSLNAQTEMVLEKGTVSFLSSRNVYVKFSNTENINIGDTLFFQKNENLAPALVISNKSSTSAVCTSLVQDKFKVKDEFFAKTIKTKKEEKLIEEKIEESTPTIEEEMIADETIPTTNKEAPAPPIFKQKIKGRISTASYSNLSDYKDVHRMRYAFSFRGDNIKNTRFSTDNNITFRHTLGEWEEVKENLNQALKIYALSVRYDIDSSSSLTLGRKINHRISSMGALDGLQYEKGLGKFLLGALVGSRPDYADFSINFNLFQVGAYASYVSQVPGKFQQSTLGFIEQRNHGNVDRRLVYFQHTGELMKNLNLFSSFEVDLFENINNEVKNKFELTNLFISLRYRVTRKLRFSTSYDTRRNIIYYESYKNFIDQLIDNETRQGLRFGVSYRPFKLISWGMNSSMRFQKSDANISRNFNSYISFSRVPVLNLRASLRVNFLETHFLNSQIFSINLSKEIIRRKLNGECYFRRVNYRYKSNENIINQNVAGASLALRLMKKLSLYLYYEGTFDNQQQQFHRFNTKIIRRF